MSYPDLFLNPETVVRSAVQPACVQSPFQIGVPKGLYGCGQWLESTTPIFKNIPARLAGLWRRHLRGGLLHIVTSVLGVSSLTLAGRAPMRPALFSGRQPIKGETRLVATAGSPGEQCINY